MDELHEEGLVEPSEIDLQWFAKEKKDDDDEGESSGDDGDKGSADSDDEVDELDFTGMTKDELLAASQHLLESNKRLAATSRKRLHEIMDKKAKLREKEQEDDERRKKDLEEKEEYKKLYEEAAPQLDLLKKDTAKTQVFFEKALEQRKEALPAKFHGLIPKLDIRDQIEWIDTFMTTLPAETPAASGGAAGEGETEEAEGDGKPAPSLNTTTPPEGSGAATQTAQQSIEQQIANCKNADELERLLEAHGRRTA